MQRPGRNREKENGQRLRRESRYEIALSTTRSESTGSTRGARPFVFTGRGEIVQRDSRLAPFTAFWECI